MSAVEETISYREKNDVSRKDFMQLLIQLKNKGYIDDADSKKRGDGQEGPEADGEDRGVTFPKIILTFRTFETCWVYSSDFSPSLNGFFSV